MLKRIGQSRNLVIIKELAMEVMQRIDYDPKRFRQQFICDKYAIDKSKIFYLYDVGGVKEKQVNKLLDFDELLD